MASLHLVVPGQVIASSAILSSNNDGGGGGNNEDSFLKGHGTYLERVQDEQRLVASVVGIVHRVNKLITVIPASSVCYEGQVGDLVVGQVMSVGTNRWKIQLTAEGREAQLPLTGIVLPGGVQRVKTAQDQRDMRRLLQPGDYISAEVHKVSPNDGSLLLHTRSTKYGKLDYGTHVRVPPALVARRKNHYWTDFLNVVDVLWGCNGQIWIQRKLSSLQGYHSSSASKASADERDEDRHEQLRQEHAATPLLKEDRVAVARVRNAIECLSLVHAMVTPEHVERVYQQSLDDKLRPADMLLPDNVIHLTSCTRQ